jgi:hypothetical protein
MADYESRAEAEQALTDSDLPVGSHVEMNHAERYELRLPDGSLPEAQDAAAAAGDKPKAERKAITFHAVAQEGDLAFRLPEGAGIPAAELQALVMQMARRFGIPLDVVDPTTGNTVRTVQPGEKAERAARIAVPTEAQKVIISLCTRPEGADTFALFQGGAAPGGKFNTIAWWQHVKACEKFGYVAHKSATIKNNKPISVYHLSPIAGQNEADVEADPEYRLAAD